MTKHILIIDDARTVEQACTRANIKLGKSMVCTLVRPFRWRNGLIEQTLDDARELIRINPRYDVWVLDNDLGPGLDGYLFLREMCTALPNKIPDQVLSCSANPVRRAAIVDYFRAWYRVSKIFPPICD
jgi:hypothetical protein